MKLTMNPHAMSIKPSKSVLLWLTIYSLVAVPVQAELFSLSASGKITLNSIADPTIPVGTPWTFEIIYDTAAPDLDFELTGAPDSHFWTFYQCRSHTSRHLFPLSCGNLRSNARRTGRFRSVQQY